jgi:hypothetical protein
MDFRAGTSILGEIEEARANCSCGIFLFSEDDPLEGSAGGAAPRDNVVFEAGHFMSSKGASRCLIIREGDAKMPADLGGAIYVPLDRTAGVEAIEGRLRRFLETSLWVGGDDYSLQVILRRLLVRTVRRLVTDEDLANGNHERLSRLLSRNSILLWAMRSHAALRKEYEATIAATKPGSAQVVRHRSPKETKDWIETLRDAKPTIRNEQGKSPTGLILSSMESKR